MKNYLKYPMLITLILMITIGLANAQPPVGTAIQANPYESKAGAIAGSTGPAPTYTSAANMWDGDLTTSGTAYFTGTTGTEAWIEFNTYGNTPPSLFTITWLSLQIKWGHTGTTDDTYKWQYSIDGVTYVDLTTATTAKFDSAGAVQIQSFSQLARPGGGAWTWADVGNLRVRVYYTRGSTSWDGLTKKITIAETWISAYSTPVPPSASPTMSLQPVGISAGTAAYDYVFVEIYCSGVTALAGWEYNLHFDPAILIPSGEYWNYYPWTDIAAPDIGADYVHVDGTIPVADPLLTVGVTGDLAVARIYFMLNDDGTGLPPAPNFSWLRLTMSFMGDPEAGKMPHSVYNGYYGTPQENAFMMGSSPVPKPDPFPYGTPTSTNWVEEYPVFGNAWHLTSWTDNDDTILSAGDTLSLTPTTPPGPLKDGFALIQIWECNADPNTYAFMILIGTVPEFPLGIGIVLGLAPAILVIYIWRTRPRKRVAT